MRARTVSLVYLVCGAEGEKSATSGTGATRGWFVWLAGPANPLDEPRVQIEQRNQMNQINKNGESERSQSTLIRPHPGSAGLFLWGVFRPMLEDVADLFLQSWQIPFYHCPDFRQVNAEIVMDQHMAHLDDL